MAVSLGSFDKKKGRKPGGIATNYGEDLLRQGRCLVRNLVIPVGQQLPRHSHIHCTKILIVAEGSAKVQSDTNTRIYFEGDVIQMPFATPHSICNIGKIDLRIVEVKLGTYLQEDDVVFHSG